MSLIFVGDKYYEIADIVVCEKLYRGICEDRRGKRMNIYEIDNAMFSLIDEETGEIKDYEAFEELQMQREEKSKYSVMV